MLKDFVRGLLLGLAAASAAALAPAIAAAQKLSPHQVAIDGVKFMPQELTVRVGESVVWINQDPFPHTVTALGGQFDSHAIAAGKSWTYRATKAGVFAYSCTLHPTMQGTLRVE